MKTLRRGPRQRAPKHPKTLAERLWAMRERHGLTQPELAAQMGVVQQTVANWEKGVSEPSGSNWLHLERILGTPRAAFVTGRGFRLPDGDLAAEARHGRLTHLPPLQAGTQVMRVDQMGLASEAMSLAESRKALTEAVKSGRPVWLVVG